MHDVMVIVDVVRVVMTWVPEVCVTGQVVTVVYVVRVSVLGLPVPVPVPTTGEDRGMYGRDEDEGEEE